MADISLQALTPPPKWFQRFARAGLATKGVVYCLVGLLAFMAAFNLGGQSTNDAGRSGVFQLLLDQPFGKALLAIVVVGLACYSVWRVIEGVNDTEHKGKKAKGIASRLGYVWSGLLYGALAYSAAKLVLGQGSSGGDSRQSFVREALQQPLGKWLVIAVGIGVIGYGLYQMYRAWTGAYKKKVQQARLKSETEAMMIRAGKVGYVARGIVWVILGYFLIRAGIESNPGRAGGSTAAFQWLENSPYGSWLLGAVALGLICYGVFMFMRAKYQPIHSS